MKVTVSCVERNKVKVYTGDLIDNGIGVVIVAVWDKKGSSYIKRIKKSNVIKMGAI